jgi:hypothetical protein
MRPPRMRFTIQCMMIAIALTTVLLSGIQTARRWLTYREEYRLNANFEEESRRSSLNPRAEWCAIMPRDEEAIRYMEAENAKYSRELAEHFRMLKEKYALAMSRPWLRVAHDPPTPED